MTSVELDPETRERLHRLAASRSRSPQWILHEAVEQYAEREEKRQQLRQDASDVWALFDADGLHLTGAEADRWLAKLENGEDADPPECHK